MQAAGQPATIPGEFLERVNRWARSQPDPDSLILFGSRARGDYGPESDWDIALVFDGQRPSLDGLPHELAGAPVDWVPMERADRVASVLRASGEVLAAVCEASRVDEGRARLQELAAREDELYDDLAQLESTACPAETLQRISAGLEAWPDTPGLWDLLMAPPAGRASESQVRGRAPRGR